MDRKTDAHMQTGYIMCPILYAIATGQKTTYQRNIPQKYCIEIKKYSYLLKDNAISR